LQTIAPGVIKNIDRENISVSQLAENLRLYNEQMIKKLALQDSEDNQKEARDKAGKATKKRLEEEIALQEFLGEKIQKARELSQNKVLNEGQQNQWADAVKEMELVLLSEKDIITKGQEIKHLLSGTGQVVATTNFNETEFNKIYRSIDDIKYARQEEEAATIAVEEALQAYTARYDMLMGKLKDGNGKEWQIGSIEIDPELDKALTAIDAKYEKL